MAKLKVKKGDKVVVLAGRDKGKRGEILKVIPDDNKAVVRGVNIVRRHQKQAAAKEGGIISKEAPIHVSNIAIEDPKDGEPSRIGYRILDDGRKVRFAKRSGELIDESLEIHSRGNGACARLLRQRSTPRRHDDDGRGPLGSCPMFPGGLGHIPDVVNLGLMRLQAVLALARIRADFA